MTPLTSQAASSGRMADLLGGELTGGFIGFEAVSRGMGRGEEEGEEGEEGTMEEVSHATGTQFQVVMKQLGKRDTTTKLKVEATTPTSNFTLHGNKSPLIAHLHRHCRSSLACVRENQQRQSCQCSMYGSSCTTSSAQYVYIYM